MATGSPSGQHKKVNVFRYASTIVRWIIEPPASVDEKQRRRVRLLSTFLLLITINTLIGAIAIKNAGNSSWAIMAATAAVLAAGYILSRTGYHRLATVLAVVIPAFPIFSTALFSANKLNITNELPWLALPLLLSSILLSLRHTTIIAIIYFALIVPSIPYTSIPAANIFQSLAFLLMIFFFVVAITAIRQYEQSEIERQLTERRRMEKEIKESEGKFSKAFHASPDGIAISTLSDGTFLEVNDSFTHIMGYSRKEFIGQNANTLSMWANPKQRDTMLRKVRKRVRMHNEELDFRTKSGEIRTVLFSSEYVQIGGGKCLLSVITDITERKRMEQALKESEEKFYTAFKSSPQMYMIINLKTGRCIEANDSYIQNTGYTREELLGQGNEGINLWATKEDEEKSDRLLQEQGRIRNEELNFRVKSGEIRTWLCSVEMMNIGGDPCMLATAIDITERKRAEKLQKDENYVLTLLGQGAEISEVLDAIVLLDESHNPAIKGSVMLYDLSKELLFPAASPSLPEKYIKLMENGIPVGPNLGTCGTAAHSKEIVIEPDVKNGTFFPKEVAEHLIAYGLLACWSQPIIGSNGELLGTIANYSEKTGEPSPGDLRVLEWSAHIAAVAIERKEAEEALRLSDAAFKSIHESIIVTDTEGKITHWNNISEELFGIKAPEAIGKEFPEVVEIVENYPGETEDKIKIIKTGGHWEDERLYRTRKGEIWMDVRLQNIVDNGKRHGQVMLATDITQRKKAEAELKQALLELEHSSAQLAATNKELETFSYSVSHDLRAPLRSIDGFSQALLEDYSDKLDESGRDYLQRLRAASQKMGELIDGLLKLSRLTRSEMRQEQVNLTSLAEEVSTRLQETQPNRKTKFIIDKGLTARGDPQLLRVLIENLFGNAWKFTGKKRQAKIEFGSSKVNGKRTYFVKDNGIGFDMTYADKLFGAFQRLHDTTKFPGTGIGLATVQRIINRHGGTIRAEGAEGKGATFYFTLE
jgi:PAS domain S-box-containing protein